MGELGAFLAQHADTGIVSLVFVGFLLFLKHVDKARNDLILHWKEIATVRLDKNLNSLVEAINSIKKDIVNLEVKFNRTVSETTTEAIMLEKSLDEKLLLISKEVTAIKTASQGTQRVVTQMRDSKVD